MTDRPRVAVNLTWLDPGRVGGSEEYLTRQLMGVEPADIAAELYCIAAFIDAHPGLAAKHPIRQVPAGSSRPGRIIVEHTWLAARTRGADVIHHGGGTAPLVGGGPVVLTIHDLQYLVYPEYFSASRRRYLATVVPRSIRRAAVVAVPSNAVRAHVIGAFGLAEERVVVVPHGVPDRAEASAADVADVRQRFGLVDRPYVVYPAITHPHKRHRVLVDMIDHLDGDTMLVLIGGEGQAEAPLRAASRSSRHADRIVRPGRVSTHERDALLVGADALVFPSKFEGFGAPLVEAMAHGTPVVCSDAEAVVEVVGDAGVVVGDDSGAAWADGVRQARRRREDLVVLGHRRRLGYTVERSGAAITAAYRQAAGS